MVAELTLVSYSVGGGLCVGDASRYSCDDAGVGGNGSIGCATTRCLVVRVFGLLIVVVVVVVVVVLRLLVDVCCSCIDIASAARRYCTVEAIDGSGGGCCGW